MVPIIVISIGFFLLLSSANGWITRQSRIDDYEATIKSGSRNPRDTFELMQSKHTKKALVAIIICLVVYGMLPNNKVSYNEDYRPPAPTAKDTVVPKKQYAPKVKRKHLGNPIFYGDKYGYPDDY